MKGRVSEREKIKDLLTFYLPWSKCRLKGRKLGKTRKVRESYIEYERFSTVFSFLERVQDERKKIVDERKSE